MSGSSRPILRRWRHAGVGATCRKPISSRMHGVWSWVAAAVRAGIVRLLARQADGRAASLISATTRCRPGGARSACSGCCARPGCGRPSSDRQAAAGWELVQALREADALQLDPLARGSTSLIERMGTRRVAYLAHEYINATWRPCFHADVAARWPTPSSNGSARSAAGELHALMLADERARSPRDSTTR